MVIHEYSQGLKCGRLKDVEDGYARSQVPSRGGYTRGCTGGVPGECNFQGVFLLGEGVSGHVPC